MKKEDFIIVAIDGGAASGKSSTSKILSDRLGLLYVNSGSHYRALTWAILQRGIPPHRVDKIEAFLKFLEVDYKIKGREAHMTLGACVPAEEIRSPEVNQAVSTIAAIRAVRKFLLPRQRSYVEVARQHAFDGLIMEGRDVGTVIFPEADFRFFLLADEAERTRRRQWEGQVDSIRERDRLDKERKTAPLIHSEGAIKVDTTPLTLQEVADKLTGIILAGKK
ncbi:MAG: (d)CMP kinase [Opitutae bacterium]|nr:(d)CMP kinase [Opitutae bacterium]MBC9889353.1 (d)CMP kinase [Opitutae bacterium]